MYITAFIFLFILYSFLCQTKTIYIYMCIHICPKKVAAIPFCVKRASPQFTMATRFPSFFHRK